MKILLDTHIFLWFKTDFSLRPEAEPPVPRSQAQPGNEIVEAEPRLTTHHSNLILTIQPKV